MCGIVRSGRTASGRTYPAQPTARPQFDDATLVDDEDGGSWDNVRNAARPPANARSISRVVCMNGW
jgi:hypothetical protein